MEYGIFIIIVLTAVFLSVKMQKLTLPGGIIGGVLATCIYLGAGFTGFAMLGSFFVLGTVATSIGSQVKQSLQVAEQNAGRRTAGQVLANGGLAGLAGLGSGAFHPFGALGASAASDASTGTSIFIAEPPLPCGCAATGRRSRRR